MAAQTQVTFQTDFSAGEVDPSLKRDDGQHPVLKAGLRQAANWRITDTKKLANRFGRTAKFIDGPRVDEVLMAPNQVFTLVFGNNKLSVRNAAGTVVFTSTKLGDGTTTIPWTAASVVAKGGLTWDVIGFVIYIAYPDGAPANVPQTLTWDGVSQTSTWTLATFTETLVSNQKRTPFYRISARGITLAPSATSGAGITLTASSALFTASWVGTRVRWVGRQILITAFTNSTTVTATVEETLNQTYRFTSNTATAPNTQFAIGDVVISNLTSASGQVTAVTATTFDAVMLNGFQPFTGASSEQWVGPAGLIVVTGNVTSGIAPQALTNWDDEVMNSQLRGFPSSVFVDQNRLGFCNFPSVPAGIAWSFIGLPTDLFPGAVASAGMFELAPGKAQVLYVAAGMQSSEFVFCDNAVYEIPITVTNPLKPGGVAFNKISDDGCAAVQPRRMQNVLVYINAGLSTVRAIMTTGAYLRANESRDISELHNHLFNAPIAIACPTADSSYPERYFYVLNGDGTVAVGKIAVEDGNVKPGTLPGWTPWSGVGSPTWISARAANVWFTTTYNPGAVSVAELLDSTQYLDAALSYNSVPAALAAPVGKGPLWWLPAGTCTVLDLGTRQLGSYTIDANGFLVPQLFGGENLASAQLVVGQPWTATLEPFLPAAAAGTNLHQRHTERAINEMVAYFQNSTGFVFQTLFSGRLTRASLALGAVINQRRVPTYAMDDDPTVAPPQRESAEFYRPPGRTYDPRVAVVKDTPGPLTILEIGLEASV